MSTDYGTDVSTYPDLDATFGILSGPRVVAENVARRLEEILRFTLNAEVTPLTIRVLEAQARQVALEDERVSNATSTATYANKTLSVSVRLLMIEGETFDFVLNVDQVTTELLFG